MHVCVCLYLGEMGVGRWAFLFSHMHAFLLFLRIFIAHIHWWISDEYYFKNCFQDEYVENRSLRVTHTLMTAPVYWCCFWPLAAGVWARFRNTVRDRSQEGICLLHIEINPYFRNAIVCLVGMEVQDRIHSLNLVCLFAKSVGLSDVASHCVFNILLCCAIARTLHVWNC